MGPIVAGMISPSSLSAFSTPGVAAPQAPQRPEHPKELREARAQPAAPHLPLQTQPGAAPPSRTLPRGSLLDLSV